MSTLLINYSRIDSLPDEEIKDICDNIGLIPKYCYECMSETCLYIMARGHNSCAVRPHEAYNRRRIFQDFTYKFLYTDNIDFGFTLKDCTLNIYVNNTWHVDTKIVSFVNGKKHGLETKDFNGLSKNRTITYTTWNNGDIALIETFNFYTQKQISLYKYKNNLKHGKCLLDGKTEYYIDRYETCKFSFDCYCRREITKIKNIILEVSPLIKDLISIITDYAYDEELGYL